MTPDPYFTDVEVNGRWRLRLPDFRALRYTTVGPLGWERERIASMHVNLCDTDTLLDVGAESGDMTALFAGWVESVVVVEPNPVAWPNIKATFDANNIPAPLAHWVGFVADTARGDSTGPYGPGWPGCVDGPLTAATGFRDIANPADVTATAATTIDALIRRLPEAPTAVTMDIEGAELHALRGAVEFLDEYRPLLWVSIHPRALRQHHQLVPADVYQFLERHDYRVTHLADDHETHIMAEPR